MSLDVSRKNRAARRKVHARRARLQLESLEQRRLMAIVANAGDPFFLNANQDLVVSANVTATPPAPAATYTYNWDLNNDGDFNDPGDFSTTSPGAIIPAATLALPENDITPAALAGGPITIGLQIIQSGTGAIGLDTAKVYAANTVTANANGPYAVEEGEEFEFPIDPVNAPNGPTTLTALVLDASGSVFAGNSATYSWNLDSDPDFEVVTTQRSLRLSWADLEALNPSLAEPIDGLDPADVRTISVTVEPASGGSSTATTTLSILNVAPSELSASLTSQTTLLTPKPLTGGPVFNTPFGEELTLNISGNDPSTVDLDFGLTYTIDWGDNSGVDTVTSSTTFVLPPPTHTYVTEGTYTISITVADKDGGERNIFQQVRASRVYADEFGSIFVHGTDNNDRIIVTGNQIGGISIRMNNTFYPPISLGASGLPLVGGSLYIYGNAGNDTISIAASQLASIEIYGGAGDDYIAAGNEGNLIYGGAGDDRIISYAGADFIFGDGPNDPDDQPGDSNTGNDYISAGAGDDYVEAGPGNDTVNSEGGNDIVYGGDGNDKLNGGTGEDQLYGEAGTNILDGGDDNDLLYGGSGQDTMYGRDGLDVLIGNGGVDTLRGGNDDDLLIGNIVGVETDARNIFDLWTTGKNFSSITNNYILPAGKITEDGAADILYGENGADWFIAYLTDSLKDFKTGDAKTVNKVRLA